jgi:hypothetical protein
MNAITQPLSALPRHTAALGAQSPRPGPSPDLLILARRLLQHQDIASMVQIFGRETGAYISVEHPRGNPLATHPALRAADLGDQHGLAEFPIHQGSLEIGVIHHSAWLNRTVVDLAATIFAHPLLREVDRDIEERRQFGATLLAVIEGEGNGRELRALLRKRGIDPDEPISVVSACADDAAGAWWGAVCDRAGSHACAPALIGQQHLMIMQSDAESAEHAQQLFTRLERVAPRKTRVGIGEAPGGAVDLRTALLEAREAMGRGVGINERMPLTIDRLLCALPTGALQEHTRSLLEPVLRHDAERQTELLKTLRVLVAEDFSTVRAAKTLFVHQNTVKYRVAQIGDLTGIEIGRIDGRVQLWIAVTLLDQPPATLAP